MDIAEKLSEEHSKENTVLIAEYIGTDSNRFELLLAIFTSDEYRLVQRASWIVSTVAEKHPKLVEPYLALLVKQLTKPKHDAVKRNVLRLLQFVAIPSKLHEELIDVCFSILESQKEAIAIRVFAMTVLEKITTPYPELQNELALILEDQMPYGSAGFQSRAKKILKRIRKNIQS